MLDKLKKYLFKNHVVQGALLVLICALYYFNHSNPNHEKDVAQLEKSFQSKVEYLENALNDFSNAVNFGDELHVIWENTREFRNLGYEYFVYNYDSLLFWTSSHIPLSKDALKVDKREILLLENGWYYKSTRRAQSYTMVGMFMVKNEFPYENENLINTFNSDFNYNYTAQIKRVPDQYNIRFPNGDFAFSLNDIIQQKPSLLHDLLLFFLLLIGLSKLLFGLWLVLRKIERFNEFQLISITFIGTLAIRIFIYWIDWKSYFQDSELFNPNVFASSIYSPTLADLIINVLFLVVLSEIIRNAIFRFLGPLNPNIGVKKVLFTCSLLLFFLMSTLLEELITDVIYNSDVPLNYYNILSLSPISYAFILVFFGLFWAYFRLVSGLLLYSNKLGVPVNFRGFIWFLCAVVYLIFEIFVNNQLITLSIFSLVLSALLLYIGKPEKSGYRFPEVIALLIINTLYLSILINHTQNKKEIAAREVYAKKLISEKELETEMEFAYTSDLLQNSELLQHFFSNPDVTQVPEIKKHLERKYFRGYWNRYEIDYYFYDADTLPISTYVQIKEDPAKNFEKIIRNAGVKSESNPYIFYVSDFSQNLSYLVRQPIFDSVQHKLGYVYLALRSKVIPQEIGFPRLLLNDNSNVFFKLEDYNMAKYVHGGLALRYGSFNYPISIGSFLVDFQKKSGVIEDGEYVHLVVHGDRNKTIILTKERVDLEEYVTSFSFLFSSFGLILILSQVFNGNLFSRWNTIKLAFRIQLLFIALVFFSLLFSGIGTGTYVKSQYLEYQEDQLREKVNTVQKELFSKLQYEENLNENTLTSYLEFLLNKFAGVFVTDINLYNTKGQLLASSRPEIFNLGLISSQMNARAFRQMYNRQLSLYVNQEFIGNQDYLSAYVPLINAQNQLIAYINLPYFAKQSDFENEIAGFLSAIINIFVLLLALSIVIAVFVTSKIVDPLKQIQLSLSDFKLGNEQQPIAYKGNDEIGVLVKEYNTKLKELQESSEKLAKTEREMAWREMAKQVAHEIKNPLTPMKLRIQHFQRSFDPNDEDAEDRIQKFSESLIEQIDALTNIANAFSNFAKMPKAIFDEVDIVHIMKSAVDTFSAEENVDIECSSDTDESIIEADKELLLRVFNNLIKNAIQAIPPKQQGKITVALTSSNDSVRVTITDNGSGIPEEMRDKIFVPNFTTKSTGAGLGLAMVKQIIESHQGDVNFESKPGQTIFKIILPKKQS